MCVIGGPNRIPHCRLFQILCIAGPSEGAYQRVTNFKVMREALLECGKNTLKTKLFIDIFVKDCKNVNRHQTRAIQKQPQCLPHLWQCSGLYVT